MTVPRKPRKTKPKSAEKKLTLTRIFAAPRMLVFAAWTRPEHLRVWSSPHGFTIPVGESDLRPGGRWRICMVSPEREKLWVGGVYRKVVPGRLLDFTHAWEGEEDGPETLVTVRFADHPRGTKLTFTQTGFSSTASRDGHAGGWKECFERLGELLGKLPKPGAATKQTRRGR